MLGTSTRPVLVCGPRGSGITTLLHSVAATLGSPYDCMVWTAFPQSTIRDLLSDLLVRLSPDDEPLPEDEVELADAVRTQLIRLQAAATAPVLLIDEADNLTDAVLRTLLDLGDTAAGWLRLVLGGVRTSNNRYSPSGRPPNTLASSHRNATYGRQRSL